MKALWLVRSLAVLTALLCLGLAGYLGERRWAKQDAGEMLSRCRAFTRIAFPGRWPEAMTPPASFFESWRGTPWYGRASAFHHRGDVLHPDSFASMSTTTGGGSLSGIWMPRKAYYEYVKLLTGLDLGDDPAVWEAWFMAHPTLVWDEKRNHLVEEAALGTGTRP